MGPKGDTGPVGPKGAQGNPGRPGPVGFIRVAQGSPRMYGRPQPRRNPCKKNNKYVAL